MTRMTPLLERNEQFARTYTPAALGIPARQVPLDQFHFLTRIHYISPSDGKWGEHESTFLSGDGRKRVANVGVSRLHSHHQAYS